MDDRLRPLPTTLRLMGTTPAATEAEMMPDLAAEYRDWYRRINSPAEAHQ